MARATASGVRRRGCDALVRPMHQWAKKVVKHYSGVIRLSSPFFRRPHQRAGSPMGLPLTPPSPSDPGGVGDKTVESRKAEQLEFQGAVVRPLTFRNPYSSSAGPNVACRRRRAILLLSGIANRPIANAVVETVVRPARRRLGPAWNIHKPESRRIHENGVTYITPPRSFGLTLPFLGPIIRNRFCSDRSIRYDQ